MYPRIHSANNEASNGQEYGKCNGNWVSVGVYWIVTAYLYED